LQKKEIDRTCNYTALALRRHMHTISAITTCTRIKNDE